MHSEAYLKQTSLTLVERGKNFHPQNICVVSRIKPVYDWKRGRLYDYCNASNKRPGAYSIY